MPDYLEFTDAECKFAKLNAKLSFLIPWQTNKKFNFIDTIFQIWKIKFCSQRVNPLEIILCKFISWIYDRVVYLIIFYTLRPVQRCNRVIALKNEPNDGSWLSHTQPAYPPCGMNTVMVRVRAKSRPFIVKSRDARYA